MLTVELPVLVSFFRISPQVGLALLVAVIAEAENVCENVNEPQCNMKGREFCEPVTLPDCRVTKERGKLVSDDHQGCVYSSSLVAHLAAVAASRVHIPRHSNQMLYIK